MLNVKKKKTPSIKNIKTGKTNIHDINNIITLNSCLNNNKMKNKNQLLRNSINIKSIGISLIKTKDSKDNIYSDNYYSKSNSKTKNSIINININENDIKILKQTNKQIYINNYIIKQKKASYNKIDKSNKKIMKKIKTVSPFGNTYNSRNNKANYRNEV